MEYETKSKLTEQTKQTHKYKHNGGYQREKGWGEGEVGKGLKYMAIMTPKRKVGG